MVQGRVQGVGFRYYTQKAARQLGVVGWVRNCADGTVEINVAAEDAELSAFIQKIREGPRFSKVTQVDEMDLNEDITYTQFTISR